MVPKVIATLVSYEAERHMIRQRERSPRNRPEARKKRRPRLRFTRSKGRLTGLPAALDFLLETVAAEDPAAASASPCVSSVMPSLEIA